MRREKDQVRNEIEEGIEMFYVGTIQGGTHAGWKRVFPAHKDPWTCPECANVNKPTYANCFKCSSRRP